MVLIPKHRFDSFTVKRIFQRNANAKDCAKERLDPLKAELDNEEMRTNLLNFSQTLWRATIEKDRESAAMATKYEYKPRPRFEPDEKGVLIVCFAWLGMPEMCEIVRKSMQNPVPSTVFEELRDPIQRSGGISRYQSFLTEAISCQNNISDVVEALDALVDPSSETASVPEVFSWSQKIIQRALGSYLEDRLMEERDAGTLMSLCARFGSNIYSERYVAPGD